MRSRVALILTILGLLMAVTAAPVAAASLTVNSLADTAADDGIMHAARGDHCGQHRHRVGGISRRVRRWLGR